MNFIVFGLTRSGLEHTIYRTRDEHANHCTTDAVRTALEESVTMFILKISNSIFHENVQKRGKGVLLVKY